MMQPEGLLRDAVHPQHGQLQVEVMLDTKYPKAAGRVLARRFSATCTEPPSTSPDS
jgi:hypothetical protein